MKRIRQDHTPRALGALALAGATGLLASSLVAHPHVQEPKDSKVEQLSGWMAAHCGIDSKAVATYAEALVGEGVDQPSDLAELDDGDWPGSIKTLHLKKIKAAVAKGDFDAPEPEGAMGQDDEVSPTRPGSALALGAASCRLRAPLRAGLCVHVEPLLCTGAS